MRKNLNYFPVFAACMMLTFGLAIVCVAAYLSDADKADNSFTIGGSNVEIVEKFDPPEKLTPGVSFAKDVCVQNNGPSDCYVRIKAVFSTSDMEQYCTLDWNTTDWIYNEADGYYYYAKPLKVDEQTASLFTTVKVSERTPENEISAFDIIVYTESYQSNCFATYKAAWEDYSKNKPSV